MSGTKVNNYAIGDSDIEAVMLTTDQIYKGQCQVTLTEMATTTVPKIAAGSWVEVNGTLFKFDSDETLTGSPSDGIVYIRIVPSTDTCTAEMTNTAPTWSDSKQGWYGTGGSANYRYIGGCTKSSSSYTAKGIIKNFHSVKPQIDFEKVFMVTYVSIDDVGYNVDTPLSTVVNTPLDTHAGLSSSGVYTIPIKGIYRITVDAFNGQSGNQPWMWYFKISGTTGYSGSTRYNYTCNSSTDGNDVFGHVDTLNVTRSYNIGDTVFLSAKNMYNGGGTYPASAEYFAVELLYPL